MFRCICSSAAAARGAARVQFRTAGGMCPVHERLAAQSVWVPTAAAPKANFLPYVRTGDLVYVSGQIPRTEDGTVTKGVVGAGVELEAAREAARLTTVNLLSQIKAACGGDFAKVKKIVKVEGFVAAAAGFEAHPEVLNACSDLLVEAFGVEVGAHARFAVGVSSLPRGVPVEICCVFEMRA